MAGKKRARWIAPTLGGYTTVNTLTHQSMRGFVLDWAQTIQERIAAMNMNQHTKIQRRRFPALRLITALVGVAILSGCVIAPGGYGYRVHPLIHPGWGRGWRR